jgi:hypothetical protein
VVGLLVLFLQVWWWSVKCKHCSPTHLSTTSIWFPRATTSKFRSSNFQFILAALESHFRTLNECLFILNNFQFIIIFYMNYDGILKCWGFALMCCNLEVWSHKGMLGSMVAVAFQITFCAEIHVNDVFLFFKNYFWHQHIKTMQNIQNILNFRKKNWFF